MVTVKYNIGTYSGEVEVTCEPEDDNEQIIAKAKKLLKQKVGSYPAGMYYEHYKVIRPED
jgi:hypothetical protein